MMRRLTREEVLEVVTKLDDLGFKRAEMMPVSAWRKQGWPEDRAFFELVDAHLHLLRMQRKYDGP